MFSPVLEHLNEGIPDFAGRAEDPRMISVTPHLARSCEESVQCLSGTNRESLNTAAKCTVITLDQYVDVIGLDAVLKHAEARIRSSVERSRHGSEHILPPK